MSAATLTADPQPAGRPPSPPAGAPTRAHGFWRRYGALWAGVPRELAAIAALFVIAQIAFSLAWTTLSAGAGLIPLLLIGFVVIIVGLFAARWFGGLSMVLIEWTGRPSIPRVSWRRSTGFLDWLRSTLASAHHWLYLAYALLPAYALGVASFTLTAVAVSVALGGTLWPLWGWAILGRDRGGLGWAVHNWLGLDATVSETVVYTVLGLVVLFLLPFLTRGLSWAHWGLARLMLGAFRSDALREELADAQASRAAAVAAEDTALRQLERDIHDGPQQRLIRLQMDLAAVERRLGAQAPGEVGALLASASAQAREALDELRALSRGFAPPILLDRGLIAALESAAGRSPIPVQLESALAPGAALPPELERNAYFIASEGLANAVKHSGAARVRIALASEEAPRRLVLTVRDDGRGGALLVPGHGLAGLSERVQGLGGSLSVDSPLGGPTTLVARIPW